MTKTLPTQGKKSTRFAHLGVWVFGLGPHSPVPSTRLQIAVLDQTGKVVRRFEQVRGDCKDPGYVDFFNSPQCRPASYDYPIVDIDEHGKVQAVLHPNYTPSLGMDLYLKLLTEWANKWGKAEYAL